MQVRAAVFSYIHTCQQQNGVMNTGNQKNMFFILTPIARTFDCFLFLSEKNAIWNGQNNFSLIIFTGISSFS